MYVEVPLTCHTTRLLPDLIWARDVKSHGREVPLHLAGNIITTGLVHRLDDVIESVL